MPDPIDFDRDVESDDDDDVVIKDYDIISSPNDFNVLSYFAFLERGKIKLPEFQRHYVWDIKRASKLIESLIIGLPIPQIFLYESGSNEYLIIDGQQRLMTVYYFMKGRFPKRDSRGKIRKIIQANSKISDAEFDDASLFMPFRLSFNDNSEANKLSGFTYQSLGQHKESFELRTIRSILVKQVRPDGDNSAVFELFNRLNTGGINLSVQEIRMSMYHSEFMSDLVKCNDNIHWRTILGGQADQRQRDVEILLRMTALAFRIDQFSRPLSKFLNHFANDAKKNVVSLGKIQGILNNFFEIAVGIDRGHYLDDSVKRFSVTLLESIFYASSHEAVRSNDPSLVKNFTHAEVESIKSDVDFHKFFSGKTTDSDRLKGRMSTALKYIV